MLTFLVVTFISSLTWLWDELIGTPRPKVIELIAKVPLYWKVIIGFVVLIVLVGEAAYKAIQRAEDDVDTANDTIAAYYDNRPLFVLEVIGQPDWTKKEPSGEWIFRLTNCGKRTARWVELETISSYQDNYTVQFQQIAILNPNQAIPVGYWVGGEVGSFTVASDTFLDQRMLWKFLNDVSPDAALSWWDIKVKYRDMDESVSEEIATRLCFDSETLALVTRPVPYTQNPPAEAPKITMPPLLS